MRTFLTVSLLLTLSSLPVNAQAPSTDAQPVPAGARDPKQPVVYEKEIAPMLVRKCLACHSASIKKGGLDLAAFAGLMKGGNSGPVVSAGKASESLLIQLAGRTTKPFMPPKGEEALSSQELAVLKLWIDQGARAPSGGAETKVAARAPVPAVRLVRAIVVSPDGASVIAARANQVHIFATKTGAHIRSLMDAGVQPIPAAHLAIVESLALSPDGRMLASGSFQEVNLWDVQTGALLRKLTGFADRVVALSFTPDGRLLATGGGAPTVDGEIKVLEAATGKLVVNLATAHSDTVYGVAFSPDGAKLATCGADLTVRVFAMPGGKLLKTFDGHSHHVLDVAWKPDGKLLASAGADRTVKLWDYEAGEQVTQLGRLMNPFNEPMNLKHDKLVGRVCFIGDTWDVIACGADQPIRLWKVTEETRPTEDKKGTNRGHTGRVLRSLGDGKDFLHALGVDARGSLVAAGGEDGVVRLYDAGKGQLLREMLPPQVERSTSQDP